MRNKWIWWSFLALVVFVNAKQMDLVVFTIPIEIIIQFGYDRKGADLTWHGINGIQ